MNTKEHEYKLTITWTGNKGVGTSDYRSYGRDYMISGNGKTDVFCSSDPAFRGDGSKYNPEEFLVGALSACHMLWFLHFCANSGIVITDYLDTPTGRMSQQDDGNGKFEEIILNPVVTISDKTKLDQIDELHIKAHRFCFIANSVNFEIKINAKAYCQNQPKCARDKTVL